MRDMEVPPHCRSVYDRAMKGRSKKAGILAHCLMCCGWQRREAVRCTAKNCPLYPYRPKDLSKSAREKRLIDAPACAKAFGGKKRPDMPRNRLDEIGCDVR